MNKSFGGFDSRWRSSETIKLPKKIIKIEIEEYELRGLIRKAIVEDIAHLEDKIISALEGV